MVASQTPRAEYPASAPALRAATTYLMRVSTTDGLGRMSPSAEACPGGEVIERYCAYGYTGRVCSKCTGKNEDPRYGHPRGHFRINGRCDICPDDGGMGIVVGIIADRTKEADCGWGFILDGFPRNIAQTEVSGRARRREKKMT